MPALHMGLVGSAGDIYITNRVFPSSPSKSHLLYHCLLLHPNAGDCSPLACQWHGKALELTQQF